MHRKWLWIVLIVASQMGAAGYLSSCGRQGDLYLPLTTEQIAR